MSAVDPGLTDHGNSEPSFACDNIFSDSGDVEYTSSSDETSTTENSDGDPMEIDKNLPTGKADALTLLTIPGEIRNLIYGFMTDAAAFPHRVNIVQPKENELSPAIQYHMRDRRKPPSEVTDWSRLKRKYLGLSQVNRQLREEAVNCNDGYSYNVFLSQLEAYVKDFFVNSARNLRQLSMTRIQFLENESVDVKSLSLTLARLPGHRGMFHRGNLPGWLFGTKVNAEWLSYMEQYVSRVIVRTNADSKPAKINIFVYEDHAEDWMRMRKLKRNDNNDDEPDSDNDDESNSDNDDESSVDYDDEFDSDNDDESSVDYDELYRKEMAESDVNDETDTEDDDDPDRSAQQDAWLERYGLLDRTRVKVVVYREHE